MFDDALIRAASSLLDACRARHRLADGAVRGDEIGRHAELLGLGGVGVGDEAALDDVGGAGDLRE